MRRTANNKGLDSKAGDSTPGSRIEWLITGDVFFEAAGTAIAAARSSVRLECYIYASDELGIRFRDHLTEAARRGVKVRVLLDYLGSQGLSERFWAPLLDAGGEFRWFNPTHLKPVRDHRKIIVCDDTIAFA